MDYVLPVPAWIPIAAIGLIAFIEYCFLAVRRERSERERAEWRAQARQDEVVHERLSALQEVGCSDAERTPRPAVQRGRRLLDRGRL
jgi:hypothetical protein